MILVPLEKIIANPWQTRQAIDEEYVKELAGDIAARASSRPETLGLLHVPVGRLVYIDGRRPEIPELSEFYVKPLLQMDDARIQLAYGHNRWKAFEFLAQTRPKYRSLPIEVVQFTDEEMATSAWSENAARKDLTAIEEADAIARMIEHFGWTHEQVGKKLHLSRTTITNKLRLRTLPTEVRQQVQAGAMSERQAMAILPVLDLPEAGLKKAGYTYQKLTTAIAHPAGHTADALRKAVAEVVTAATVELDENVPPVDLEIAAAGTRSTTCQGCELMITAGGKRRCKDPACLDVRSLTWQRQELAAAAEVLGLSTIDPVDLKAAQPGEVRDFATYGNGPELVAAAVARGCPNLRLAWKGRGPYYDSWVRPESFPRVMYVCLHISSRQCACEHERETAEKTAREAARAEEQQRIKALRAQVEQAVSSELQGLDEPALRMLVRALTASYNDKDKVGSRSGKTLARDLVRLIVDGIGYWDGGRMEEAVQKWCEVVGLTLPASDDPGADPLAKARRRYERLADWSEHLYRKLPTVDAVQGNLDNVARLSEEIDAIEVQGDDLQRLKEKGDLLLGLVQIDSRLREIQEAIQAWDDTAGAWDDVSWLVGTPCGDVNFEGHLKTASAGAVRYALACVRGLDNHKNKTERLERQLRKLEKEGRTVQVEA